MLVIFFGTSCVGKTTLMTYLCEHYGWKKVPVYTTRSVRDGESEKNQISLQELKNGEHRGRFLPLNYCYGNYYGTPTAELKQAVQSGLSQIWCLDFPIERRQLFSEYKYLGIVIMPKDEQQLCDQIVQSNRVERTEEILNDHKKFYQNVQEYRLPVVVNAQGEIAKTCRNIQEIVECRGEESCPHYQLVT